jgi:hypothetical protein
MNLRDYLLNAKWTDKPDFTKGEGSVPVMFKKGDKAEIKIINEKNEEVDMVKIVREALTE